MNLDNCILKIFVLILAVSLFLVGKSQARTEVGGPIFKDTVWTFDKSPYIVVQNIEVAEGVTLTIEPGVTVKFDGNYALIISGTLIARGTEGKLITFTSVLEVIKNARWNDPAYSAIIALMAASGLKPSDISTLKKKDVKLTEEGITIRLENRVILIPEDSSWYSSINWYYRAMTTSIKPGGHFFPVSNRVINKLAEIMAEKIYKYIKFTKSSTDTVFDSRGNYVRGSILEYCKIEYANTGISSDSTTLLVKHCIISNNRNVGIQIENASSIISNNTITSNAEGGIKISNSNKITIFNNLIRDNGLGGIVIDEGRTINIKRNIIRCNYRGRGGGGGISINNSKFSASIAITNNTIAGNKGEFGGVYIKAEGKVDISDNRIINNSAISNVSSRSRYGRGGGIYIINSRFSANITKNKIINNVAYNTWGHGGGDGAGIFVDGRATIRENIIKKNSAGSGYGGGIYIKSGTIADNVIQNNKASSGGGIYGGVVKKNTFWATRSRRPKALMVIVENNRIISNFASSSGGGIFATGAVIKNNTIANNSCDNDGGGIFASSSIMEGNAITNNHASGNGGGIHASADYEKVYIKRSTIVANGAKKEGDGIFWNRGTVTISDCNFYGSQYCHLYNNSKNDIAAINNWWDTTNTLEINKKIYDFFDNEKMGKANYRPFFSSLNSNAPSIPLIPPKGLTAENVRTMAVSIVWNAVNSTDLAGYKVYYDTDSKEPPYEGTGADGGKSPIDVGKVTSYRLFGLKPGTKYYIAITAYNTSGAESLYSETTDIFVNELSDRFTVIDEKTIDEGYKWSRLRKAYPGDKIRVSGIAKELAHWVWGIRYKGSRLSDIKSYPVNSPYVTVQEKGEVMVWSEHRASRPLKVRLERLGKLDFNGPVRVPLIGLLLIALTLPPIIFQNEKDERRQALEVCYYIWLGIVFLIVSVCFIQRSDFLFRRSVEENTKLAIKLFGIPSAVIFLSHWEGVMMTIMHIKYIFKNKPMGEAMTEEKKKKKKEKKKKEFQQQEQEVKESAIVAEIAKRDTTIPDIESPSGDLDTYKGYLGEHERRFQERQLKKSIEVTRERIDEAKKLYQGGAELQKAKVDFVKAKHEYSNVDKEITLADLESQAKLAEAESKVKTAEAKHGLEVLRIEAEKAELGAEIEKVKSGTKQGLTREDKMETAKKEELLKQEIKAEILERNMAIRARLIEKAKETFPEKREEEIEDFVDSQMVESGLMPDI